MISEAHVANLIERAAESFRGKRAPAGSETERAAQAEGASAEALWPQYHWPAQRAVIILPRHFPHSSKIAHFPA